jgi:hypothetical protein
LDRSKKKRETCLLVLSCSKLFVEVGRALSLLAQAWLGLGFHTLGSGFCGLEKFIKLLGIKSDLGSGSVSYFWLRLLQTLKNSLNYSGLSQTGAQARFHTSGSGFCGLEKNH